MSSPATLFTHPCGEDLGRGQVEEATSSFGLLFTLPCGEDHLFGHRGHGVVE